MTPFWIAGPVAVALWFWCIHQAMRARDRFLDLLATRRPELDVCHSSSA